MPYTLAQHYNALDRAHEALILESRDYEDRADAAGCALTDKLNALEKLPQHIRDRELGILVNHLFAGSKEGRELLTDWLHKIAQDVDPKPTAVVMRWHFGGES